MSPKRPIWIALFAMVLATGQLARQEGQAAPVEVEAAPGTPAPGPSLTPQEVVGIQLSALAKNDEPLPNSGIATVFRFASPTNREMTGPLDRFTLMVYGETYRDMINHQSSRLLEARTTPTHTLVPVELTTRIGTVVQFVFVLTQYAGEECPGCWMTDAVMPVGREPTATPQNI